LYSVINLLGLVLSLTCAVIIVRYVYSELTVDGFNKKMNRIFATTIELSNSPGEYRFGGVWNPNHEKSFVDITGHPGVEKHALYIPASDHEITLDNRSYNVNLLAIDTVFLQILDYPVIAGERNIRRPEDVFLTETLAAKIFGKEDPVGKTLFYSTINKTITVAGIIRMPPHKSVLSFDMLVASELNSGWDNTPQSLVLLYPGVNYHEVNGRYSEFIDMKVWGCGVRHLLFPWKDVYLNGTTVICVKSCNFAG
jgi:hypothetical protein